MATKKEKTGSVSPLDIHKIINKKAGFNVAFSLKDEDPSSIKEWIPTGSRWLDSIIAKGKLAGIPVGRISEIAGIEGSGKSYMAAQIAAQAQKMGIHVIYFDSESAIDQEFIENIGIDLDKFTYVQAHSVEFVYRTIEEILSASDGVKYLFIWDSYANTSSESDLENDEFNPQSSMAKIPRISSLGMKKLTIPIANNQATLIVLNQLKTNLGDPNAMKMEPWFTPGGKALLYAYSLRIWLTARKTKDSFVINSNGYKIGSEIKAKLKKSRFGSEGRECSFKIIWGQEPIGIQDDESIFEAIKPFIEQNGAWYAIKLDESTVKKFQQKEWLELMKEEKFRNKIMEIMDYEVIEKFKNKTGDAKVFYDIDNEIKDFTEDEG